jgi:hypothetical protein
MQIFKQLSDTHVQITDGAISKEGTFYERVYNFKRLDDTQISFTRYYKYLELCKTAMLGVTPESIETLFEPIVKFAKIGNNTLTVDAVAAVKHDILNLYENIKERTKLAINAILLPLEISGVFWILDDEDASGYDATFYHTQKYPLMTGTRDAKVFFLTAGTMQLNSLTGIYSSDLEQLNTVREYCELQTILTEIAQSTASEQ